MELTVEKYGMHLFGAMNREKGTNSSHWESIRAEAEPLVRQLIELNKKMEGGGYKITGYVDMSGKKVLPDHERISQAQNKLWKVSVTELSKGDKIWLINEEPEMYIGQTDPAPVDDVTDKNVYITLNNWEDYTQKLTKKKDYYVLRAPEDWDKNEELYSSDEYWIGQADTLGI